MRLRHGFEMSTKRSVGVGVGVVVRAVATSLLHLGTEPFTLAVWRCSTQDVLDPYGNDCIMAAVNIASHCG